MTSYQRLTKLFIHCLLWDAVSSSDHIPSNDWVNEWRPEKNVEVVVASFKLMCLHWPGVNEKTTRNLRPTGVPDDDSTRWSEYMPEILPPEQIRKVNEVETGLITA
jgi:hypothetical protein